MAFIVPVATAIGGGSAVLGAALLESAALSITAGVLSAQQQRAAGKFQEAQFEIDAAAEGDAARDREIKRKRNLLRAISSQQAVAGASGVSFSEGSLARIAQLDIDEASRDLLVDTASSRQRQRGLRAQGRAARFAGKAGAVTTLLDTAGGAIKTLAGGI